LHARTLARDEYTYTARRGAARGSEFSKWRLLNRRGTIRLVLPAPADVTVAAAAAEDSRIAVSAIHPRRNSGREISGRDGSAWSMTEILRTRAESITQAFR